MGGSGGFTRAEISEDGKVVTLVRSFPDGPGEERYFVSWDGNGRLNVTSQWDLMDLGLPVPEKM